MISVHKTPTKNTHTTAAISVYWAFHFFNEVNGFSNIDLFWRSQGVEKVTKMVIFWFKCINGRLSAYVRYIGETTGRNGQCGPWCTCAQCEHTHQLFYFSRTTMWIILCPENLLSVSNLIACCEWIIFSFLFSCCFFVCRQFELCCFYCWHAGGRLEWSQFCMCCPLVCLFV